MLRPLVLTLAALLLSGCLGTRTEKIHARRPPALIERNQRSMRPMTHSELEELFADEREARRVKPDLQRWNDHYRDTRAELDELLATVPRDPWRAEELERRRVVLGRAWSDLHAKTPPIPEPLPEPRGDYYDPLDDPANEARASAEGEDGEGESEDGEESEEE